MYSVNGSEDLIQARKATGAAHVYVLLHVTLLHALHILLQYNITLHII